MNSQRPVIVVSILLALVAGASLYASPYLALYRMREAVRARDAIALTPYIDFPAVRESVKASVNARIGAEMAKDVERNPFAALGVAFAAAIVNPLVDAMVTPEGMAAMLSGERPSLKREASKTPDVDAVDTTARYVDVDRFVLTVHQRGDASPPIEFTLERVGLAGWKVVGVRFPD
jgi:Protein of unknown function (DUF2939)